MGSSPARKLTALALLAALGVAAHAAQARSLLRASGEATLVPVGRPGASLDYLQAGIDGVVIPLIGPGEISGFAKVHFAEGETADKSAELRFAGVPGLPASLPLSFVAPTRGEYGDGRPGRPSAGAKIALSIPAGKHELRITGEVAGGGAPLVVLYYEGPEQPADKLPAPPPEKPRAQQAPPGGLWGFQWQGSGSIEFAYDDNAFSYSPAFEHEYYNGFPLLGLERFKEVDRFDDLLITPTLNLEARRDLIALGATRLALRYSREQFWHNEVLNNEEYRVTVRQDLGKGRSLELYYSYSPSKYLRELNDRPPLTSENTPVVSEPFRLTRNNLVATWRQNLGRSLSGRLLYTHSRYYFNKPHLEDDLIGNELRGSLTWTIAKPWRLTLDYGYRDGDGRGMDLEGDTKETSPASDGTNKRDLYQAELLWRPPFRKVIESISARARYMASYYPAEGTVKIEDDPYHVGRLDKEYAYRVAAGRELKEVAAGLGAEIGFQYAERAVESPWWWGDVVADRSWIVRTYWFSLDYRFF
jgi:hypothetical protein